MRSDYPRTEPCKIPTKVPSRVASRRIQTPFTDERALRRRCSESARDVHEGDLSIQCGDAVNSDTTCHPVLDRSNLEIIIGTVVTVRRSSGEVEADDGKRSMMAGMTRSGGRIGRKWSPAGITGRLERFADDRVDAGPDASLTALAFGLGSQADEGPTVRAGVIPAGFAR